MTLIRKFSTLLLPLAFIVGAPVMAHPKLLGANPAANAVVAGPGRVELRFSERLMTRLSGADLLMTGMPGMRDHAPMKVASTTSVGRDGKTLILVPKARLQAGTYRVDWRVVSADTHRITGTHAFSVR